MGTFGNYAVSRVVQNYADDLKDVLIDEFVKEAVKAEKAIHQFNLYLYGQTMKSFVVEPTLLGPARKLLESIGTQDDKDEDSDLQFERAIRMRKRFIPVIQELVKSTSAKGEYTAKIVCTDGSKGLIAVSSDGEMHTMLDVHLKPQGNLDLCIHSVKFIDIDEVKGLVSVEDFDFTPKKTEGVRNVNVWWEGCHGWTSQDVALFCQDLDSYLDVNYTDEVAVDSRKLIDKVNSEDLFGKLILCHGEPGTGKSFWIRGFVKTFSSVYEVAYISETDKFLSGASGYYSIVNSERPVILIFEDAGKVFAADAQNNYSNLTATLLNLTSGLISSGRKDLFLFTYNGDIGKLDAAMVRPGRALQIIDFSRLPPEKANLFLEKHECHERVDEATRLTELYAMAYGFDKDVQKKNPEKVGFKKVGFIR